MKKIVASLVAIALITSSLFVMASCADPINGIDGKDGVNGKAGLDGKNGLDGVDGKDGKSGEDGKNGEDGLTPYIGENGNWWLGDTDTGISATGPKGETGDAGAAGKNGVDGKNAENGQSIENPIFRYNVKTECLETSYDNGQSWIPFSNYPPNTYGEDFYVYPLESRTILEGPIDSISTRYVKSSGMKGAIISLEGLDYDTVTLTPSENYKDFSYAFLTAKPVLQKPAQFCEGYYEVIYPESPDVVTLSIPEDAKYLYVYNSDGATVYLPASIVFSNSEK